jgi:hypothetical protein
MATLIPNEEETLSDVLKWDDESLGKLVKQGALSAERLYEACRSDGHLIKFWSLLVYTATKQLKVNAETTTVAIENLTYDSIPMGSYEVVIRRLDTPVLPPPRPWVRFLRFFGIKRPLKEALTIFRH